MAVVALAPPRTLADVALPGRGVVYNTILVVLGSLLVVLFARLAITLPFTPVPITGQTYAVLLVGAMLSVFLYILEGGVGLPFFAAGASGWGKVLGATGGYLLSYLLAAFVVGWPAERCWQVR